MHWLRFGYNFIDMLGEYANTLLRILDPGEPDTVSHMHGQTTLAQVQLTLLQRKAHRHYSR